MIAACGVITLGLGREFVYPTLATPLAMNNLYERQYQMGRFARDHWRAPVAVNDPGWVSYRNPNYVLDLGGLASLEARRSRAMGWPAGGPLRRPFRDGPP